MKESTIVNIIKWIIAASFFTPLIVLDQFYFPFIVPKTLVFQVLIEVALFLYIILAISNKSYLPKFDVLTKSVLVFLGVFTIAAIFGENIFRSFFGTFERMLGIFNLAHFVALFLIAKSIFLKKRDWIFLFRSFLAAGFIVGLYGLGQKIGFSFLYNSGTNRIDATIGNAAFFSAYMMFNAFFAMFLLFSDKNKFKYFYGVSLFVSLLALYLSSTRGAILGVLASFLFLGGAFFFKNKSNLKEWLNPAKNKIFNWMLKGLFLVLILALFNANAFLEPIKRLTSISLTDSTTKTRILSAGVSWEGVKEHPILGWGMENYNLIFDKYYDPRLYPAESWFDHAHNIIFDTLSSAGFVGLLSYLAIFAAAIYLLLQYRRKNEDNFFVSYLFMALLFAYFFQNIFVFDSLVTYLSFFFLLAFFVFLTSEKEEIADKKANIPIQPAVLLIVILGFLIYGFNVKPAQSSYFGIQALQLHPSRSDEALRYFEKSLDTALMGKPEMRSRMVEYAQKITKIKNMPEEQKRRFFDKTEEELRKTAKEEPDNFRYYLFLSSMAAVDRENRDLLLEADKVLEKSLEFAPQKPTLYLQRYRIKALLGENEEALRNLKKAAELTGSLKFEMTLAFNYAKLGQKQKSIDVYNNILNTRKLSTKQYIDVAVAFAKMGEEERAIKTTKKIIELFPKERARATQFIKDIKEGKIK